MKKKKKSNHRDDEEPRFPDRRTTIRTMAEWALGALLIDISGRMDERHNGLEVLAAMLRIGREVDVPVFTGRDLVLLTVRLDHDGEDYVLRLLTVRKIYKDAKDCVEQGAECIAQGRELLQQGVVVRIDASDLDLETLDRLTNGFGRRR